MHCSLGEVKAAPYYRRVILSTAIRIVNGSADLRNAMKRLQSALTAICLAALAMSSTPDC